MAFRNMAGIPRNAGFRPSTRPTTLIAKIKLSFVMFAAIIYMSPAFTDSLNSYCVKPARPPFYLAYNPPEKLPPKLSFNTQGRRFQIIYMPRERFILTDENNSRLADFLAQQGHDGGGLEEFALINNDWLWIDGSSVDYIAHIDTNKIPPEIGTPIPMPELYNKPTSHFERWFDWSTWGRAPGKPNKALGRVFVSGYPVTGFLGLLWPQKVSYEIVDGLANLLPKELQNAELYDHLESENGALFQGQDGEVLFYDGTKVTPLLRSLLLHNSSQKIPPHYFFKMPYSGRIIGVIKSKENPLTVDLTSGPNLRIISSPRETLYDLPQYLEFKNHNHLFLVARDGIYIEDNDAFKKAVTVRPPWEIQHTKETFDKGYFLIIRKINEPASFNPADHPSENYYYLEDSCTTPHLGYLSIRHPLELPEH